MRLKTTQGTLICPDGHKILFQRRKSKTREKGHIKNYFCPWCNCERQCKEIRERDYNISMDGYEWR